MKRILFILNVTVVLFTAVTYGEVLFQDSFEKGAVTWEKQNQAFVSDSIIRRPGTKSLLIKQWNDEDSNSWWLSPIIKNTGKPVKISFWAADNYYTCRDFSYAACVNIVNCDKEGKEVSTSDYLFSIPWDDSRKMDMWGKLLPSGMVWKYYERIYRPQTDAFRIKFHWPKPLLRGECYLTDIMVTEATSAEIAENSMTSSAEGVIASAGNNLKLEISMPVYGNLFYKNDPLQFNILVYSEDQKPFMIPDDAMLEYEITDYQFFNIGRGKFEWAGARPVEDASFYKSPVGIKRRQNLLKTVQIEIPEAKQPGREFFLNVLLTSKGKILASDTVTYAYVDPKPIAPEDFGKCHFSLNYFNRWYYPDWAPGRKESVSEKIGAAWSQEYDYEWKRCQPHYPGPVDFGPKKPSFPRLTWCPNIEQERIVEKWIRDEVPPEAIIPDPLHPGRVTFQIDPYVEYIVSYIRHNREAIARVVPSGLEREIDARTIELHRKAYSAIKKEFPDLPVGFMLYGLSMNPSADVDLFIKEKLYECTDFLDTHIYASSVDWSEWERLKQEYKKIGRNVPLLVSTEFCRVGGMDQIQKSRDMIASHLDAIAHGMENIFYFNCINTTGNIQNPFLRGSTDLGGTQTSGFMFMQRVDRPVMSNIVMEERLKNYRWGPDFGGGSLMPLLQTMTYYNLVQNFETAVYRETIHPDNDTLGYVFDRGNTTIIAIWLQNPAGKKTFLVQSQIRFRVQDMFGRVDLVIPDKSGALLTVDENPLTIIFDQKLDKVVVVPVKGGMKVEPVVPGLRGSVELVIPEQWQYSGTLEINCTVDGKWPEIKSKKIKIRPGLKYKVLLPFTAGRKQASGIYPLTARLYKGKNLVGVIKGDLKLQELLSMEIDTIPVTKNSNPAIKVTVKSLSDKQVEGKVIFEDLYFTETPRPQTYARFYRLQPKGSAEIVFPVTRSQVNLATTYEIPITLEDSSGFKRLVTEEVGFRACERAPGSIEVDGDLSDWKLEERTPIPFEREFTSWAKSDVPPVCAGEFYTMWDENNLYFAVKVKKFGPFVHRSNDISIWMDDNILVGLYPWRWKKGQPLYSGYYREHLGLCADGSSRIFRVGNVSGGPTTDEGTKIAVKQISDGYVYEWAYSWKSLFPLKPEPGKGFRLSLFVLDADLVAGLRGISFGGFNENVDARPVKWREFIFVP